LALLPGEGVTVRHLALPAGYPAPSEADLAETARRIAATPADSVLLVDGLAYGAMPERLVAGFGRPVVALVHHPLALESGLAPERRSALLASERAALALASRVVVTSPLTGRLLAETFGVAEARIAVAEPGTEPARRARGSGSPVRIVAVGAVSPRKGYEVLVEALAMLGDLDLRATIVGSTARDPAAAESLRSAIERAGLDGRIVLAGAVSDRELDALYDAADLFVSPSLFEGYGMGLGEALARGLPIVASTGGAAAETVPDQAALKVPPGDTAALAAALRRAVADPELRRRLADAAWAAGQGLPRWPDTAARVARVLREVSR
jgi:glycosyltransferase involved in cell wall biosynthesis